MLVFVVSLALGCRTPMFQMSGLYCRSYPEGAMYLIFVEAEESGLRAVKLRRNRGV